MPYHIGEKGSHGCAGFPVVKDSDNEVMGCHKTKIDAKKQLAALYANEPEASKEKAMAMDYTTGYASIVKYDKNDDGTLMVFGKATDDTLDLDAQICDPKWLDEAMPQWFKSGGNIREMHGPSAAGVAKEYEAKSDGHYIGVHVVDPIAVKKVEARVYTGFSIGIKSPRVVRDVKAANGRIVDGQIIEVSLVDRPANPSAKLILAKSVEGESSLVQVEELHEYKAPLPTDIFKYNEEHDESGRFSAGDGGGDSSSEGGDSRDSADQPRDLSVDRDDSIPNEMSSDMAHVGDGVADLESELINSSPGGVETVESEACASAQESLVQAVNSLDDAANADNMDDHRDALETALEHLNDAHDSLSDVDHGDAEDYQERIGEAASMLEDYLGDITEKSLTIKEKSKMRKINRITELAKSLTTVDSAKFDATLFDNARRALAELIASEAVEMAEGHDERESLASLIGAVHALMTWYEGEEHEGEVAETEEIELSAKAADDADADGEAEAKEDKAAEACADGKCGKCSECMSEKDADTTREQEVGEAPVKSVDAEEPSKEDDKEDSETNKVSDAPSIEDVVEKAVKSAMESVKAEIDALRADKEAAVEKSIKLESELATALNKAVAGGPKRTANATVAVSNEYLVKALTYKAKADATTDPVLAKGYRDLHDEFLAKANAKSENK